MRGSTEVLERIGSEKEGRMEAEELGNEMDAEGNRSITNTRVSSTSFGKTNFSKQPAYRSTYPKDSRFWQA